MDLTPGQQRLVFALVVVVLAGLGTYLLYPHDLGAARTGHPTRSPAATARPGSTAAGGQPSSTPSAGATSVPTRRGSPTANDGVNIYQWLPFSQHDLAQAAAVTTRFAGDYDTYRYTETAASYVATMNGLVTSELAQTLASDYATVGVAAQRRQQKQVSTGTATIDSLRAFGNSSITFVVTVSQKLVTTKGASRTSTQYAITVTNGGSGWQVNDIELASAGNQ